MIDQQLINMLDDPNPQIREKAVKQLAKTKSQDAVQYLAVVYKTDEDPDIRELARKAGLYIKKKMTEDKWTGDDPDPYADDDSDDMPDTVDVSARAVEASIGQMESAMNLHVAGEDEKAAKFVEKAFMANPNLKNDSYYLGMAATILGIRGEEVADFLLGDVEFDSKGKAKRKRKPKVEDREVTTEKVIIDLVIYFIVMATILIVGAIIFFQWLSGLFGDLLASPEFQSQVASAQDVDFEANVRAFINLFLNLGLVSTVIYSLFMSVFSVIGLLIQFAFYHFAAAKILGGDGTYKGLIHRLTNFHTFTYAISAIASYLVLYWVVNTMLAEGSEITAYNGIMALSGISSIFSIFWTLYLSKLIGNNYDFGTGRGCLTIIVSSILMSIISCACTLIFYTTLVSIVTSSVSAAGA